MIRKRHWHAIVSVAVLTAVLLAGPAAKSRAAELGHYAPALPAIRDFILPDPGIYYIQYNLYYTSDTLKDKTATASTPSRWDHWNSTWRPMWTAT